MNVFAIFATGLTYQSNIDVLIVQPVTSNKLKLCSGGDEIEVPIMRKFGSVDNVRSEILEYVSDRSFISCGFERIFSAFIMLGVVKCDVPSKKLSVVSFMYHENKERRSYVIVDIEDRQLRLPITTLCSNMLPMIQREFTITIDEVFDKMQDGSDVEILGL
jgi:hypothetical protein